MEPSPTFKRIYVIVARNVDLPDGKKICVTSASIAVQGGHALLKMAELAITDKDLWDQFLIYLSVPNASDLKQVKETLIQNGIPFVEYCDTDAPWNGQLTALATFPITKEQGAVLKDLKSWRCACNIPKS